LAFKGLADSHGRFDFVIESYDNSLFFFYLDQHEAVQNIPNQADEDLTAIIQSGVVEPLLSLARSQISDELLRCVTRPLIHLCRNPSPPIEVVKKCLPTLLELTHHTDSDVVGKLYKAFIFNIALSSPLKLGTLGWALVVTYM